MEDLERRVIDYLKILAKSLYFEKGFNPNNEILNGWQIRLKYNLSLHQKHKLLC